MKRWNDAYFYLLLGAMVFVGALFILVIADACISSAEGSIADCIDATCRVSAGEDRGTGCAYEISRGYVFVLTAQHIIGDRRIVACEFWRDGHKSRPLVGEVVQRSRTADAAVIAIPEASFGGMLPKIVPIAPRGHLVLSGMTITSVGCARGAWSTGFKGHAVFSDLDDLRFVPVPANGRSGSAIFDADGTMIVGLLRGRTDECGVATSLEVLYAGLNGEVSAYCPDGKCEVTQAVPISPPSPWRAVPYRHYQGENNRMQNDRLNRLESVWPTLPGQGSLPQSQQPQQLPLGQDGFSRAEINARFDDVYGRLAAMEKMGQDAHGAASAAVQEQLDEAKVSAEEISKKGLAAVKDVVIAKLMTFGAIPGGILVFIFIIVIRDVYQKLRTGDPLIIEKVRARVVRRVRRIRKRRRGEDPDLVDDNDVIEEIEEEEGG